MIFIAMLAFLSVSAIVAAVLAITMYNALIALKNQVQRDWGNIDIILEQRNAEIPKLISVCEQFGKYERGTFEKIMQAREKYLSTQKINEKIENANQLSDQLKQIFAVGEAYPQLQLSAQFAQLEARISSLEEQLADRKELVNEAVTNFNTRCQQVPYSIFAKILGFSIMPLYKVSDAKKQAPQMKIALP